MSMQIEYSADAPSHGETAFAATGTIFSFVRQAIRRHAERSRLNANHARMYAVSAHTLKDIGIDRTDLISITRPATASTDTTLESRRQTNGRD
jgi:hypothetical protein